MDPGLAYINKKQKEICMLESIFGLLDWDEQTNMPKGAITGRAEQVRYVNGLIHDSLTSAELSSAIDSISQEHLTERDKSMLNALKKKVRMANVIPRSFQTELSQEIILSQSAWKEARAKNDRSIFLPHFEKIVAMKRRQGKLINPKVPPYEALIDRYEEGMTLASLDTLFSFLKAELSTLLKKIQSTQTYRTHHPMRFNIPKYVQKTLIHEFIELMKLPEEKVRLSVSLHPFTTGIAPSDVRITTRYTDTLESFFTAVHEGGHALYEIGLPKKFVNTFIYSPASFGFDESQALLWEYHLIKSSMFWKSYWPSFVRITGISVDPQTFYREINLVRPSFIRVNADEITYHFHVMLRYEMEKLLINGGLEPKDAQPVWNRMMKELLNITPRNDNEGILQDIHWATGDFGYFPTYTLGNIYAAMIHKQIRKEIADYESHIHHLEFTPIIKWLIHHIYRKGKILPPSLLLKRVCGTDINPKIMISYLKEKYGAIYQL